MTKKILFIEQKADTIMCWGEESNATQVWHLSAEDLRKFIHAIAKIQKKWGFTHIVDPEMGIDEPKLIVEYIVQQLQGLPIGKQVIILEGLEIEIPKRES